MATVGKPRYNLAKQNKRETLKETLSYCHWFSWNVFGYLMQRIGILCENRAAQFVGDKAT
jgi:hypothetical protein